jgi:hypothetical protein
MENRSDVLINLEHHASKILETFSVEISDLIIKYFNEEVTYSKLIGYILKCVKKNTDIKNTSAGVVATMILNTNFYGAIIALEPPKKKSSVIVLH